MADPLPSTLWSQVLEAGRGAPDALDALITRYLEPVYVYVRATGHPRQDAEDLAHEFFLHVLETEVLSRADPARGRFRGFLVTCLRNFLSDQAARQRALKRGGDRRHTSLDIEAVERSLEGQKDQDPRRLFDRRWAQSTVDRALAALHASLSPAASQVFSLAYGADALAHKEISERTGMTEDAVAASVYRSRKKLRKVLLAEVRETVADDAEASRELEDLFRALGS